MSLATLLAGLEEASCVTMSTAAECADEISKWKVDPTDKDADLNKEITAQLRKHVRRGCDSYGHIV